MDVDVGVDHAQALETLDLAFVNEFRCRLCLKNRDGNTAKEREREIDAGSCRRPPEALPFLTHQLDFNHIHKCVCIPVHTHTHKHIYRIWYIYILVFIRMSLARSLLCSPLPFSTQLRLDFIHKMLI